MILPHQYLKMIYYFSISSNGIIEMLSKHKRQDLSFTIIKKEIKLSLFWISSSFSDIFWKAKSVEKRDLLKHKPPSQSIRGASLIE